MAAERQFVKLIEELVSYISDSDINTLDLEYGGEKIYIKKNLRKAAVPVEREIEVVEVPVDVNKDVITVKSEIVGTYFSTYGKKDLPFVEPGEIVKKGQNLCMIQCLGIDHILKSPSTGRVMEFLCKDGENVEYGQDLFRLDTSKGEI